MWNGSNWISTPSFGWSTISFPLKATRWTHSHENVVYLYNSIANLLCHLSLSLNNSEFKSLHGAALEHNFLDKGLRSPEFPSQKEQSRVAFRPRQCLALCNHFDSLRSLRKSPPVDGSWKWSPPARFSQFYKVTLWLASPMEGKWRATGKKWKSAAEKR